ncbi:MAG: sensor histidine kinase [Polaromonas sp.]|jgi:two-component system sensor histidine kinase UhpB
MLQSELAHQRSFIAQTVHDDMCGNLTALLHDMHWIVKHSDQSVVRERAMISLDTVKSTLAVGMQVLSDLHPTALEQGLTSAIAVLLSRFSHRSGIKPRCTLVPELDGLPEPLSLLIYRTVQESLTNILKHAQASEASVSVVWQGDEIRLQIVDNGRGIDASQSLRVGMGLRFQIDRAQALGGDFQIRCASGGKGVCVELIVPVILSFSKHTTQ